MKSGKGNEKRLQNRYGKGVFEGNSLADISKLIIEKNTENVAHAIATTDQRRLRTNLKRVQPASAGRSKKLVFPDVSNVIRRSKTLIKAAEDGDVLSTTLRTRMQRAVKRTLFEHGVSTTRGTVPKRLATDLKKAMTKAFKPYTKKNARLGMPAHVARIAITEARFAANTIRREYTEQLAAQNPDWEVRKKWNHNRSRHPRENHLRMHGREVSLASSFKFRTAKGKITTISGPYDPRLGPDDIVGCHCELTYKFVPRK